MAATSASATAWSRLALATASAPADFALAAAVRAVASFASAVGTASTAVSSASCAATASRRACSTSAGVAVRAWSMVLRACRWASRACAAAVSPCAAGRAGRRSARRAPNPGAGRSSTRPLRSRRRSGRRPGRERTPGARALARAGARRGLRPLMQIAAHRQRPREHEHGAAVDRHRHVAGRQLGLAARGARDDVAALLDRKVASTAGCAAPKRTVPRTMTSVDSVRRSTGTVMGAGCGAAVSAATWAGERIFRAAAQPTIARRRAPRPRVPRRDCPRAPHRRRQSADAPAATQIAKTEKHGRLVGVVQWPVQARPPASDSCDDCRLLDVFDLTPPRTATWPCRTRGAPASDGVAVRALADGSRHAALGDPVERGGAAAWRRRGGRGGGPGSEAPRVGAVGPVGGDLGAVDRVGLDRRPRHRLIQLPAPTLRAAASGRTTLRPGRAAVR